MWPIGVVNKKATIVASGQCCSISGQAKAVFLQFVIVPEIQITLPFAHVRGVIRAGLAWPGTEQQIDATRATIVAFVLATRISHTQSRLGRFRVNNDNKCCAMCATAHYCKQMQCSTASDNPTDIHSGDHQ